MWVDAALIAYAAVAAMWAVSVASEVPVVLAVVTGVFWLPLVVLWTAWMVADEILRGG